ncbi:MAG: nuclease [Burkholderiales bacterium]|nr:nuclease [Burkholderiales bacterium]
MAPSIDAVLRHLETSIADLRLSDDERRELVSLLREIAAPEEGLRRVRNRAFEMVRTRLVDADTVALLKWLDGVARALDNAREPFAAIQNEAYFSPGDDCLRAIQHRLRAARQCIDVCVFTLSDDRITEEILAAHRRGVQVRVITDNDKEFDAGSDVETLRRTGIAVAVDRTSAHMHHKFAIFDNAWLINGSYNWTRSACESNEENLVVTNDSALVRAFAEQFASLWKALA